MALAAAARSLAIERLHAPRTSAGSLFRRLAGRGGRNGKCNFYDPRRLTWTKQPFSETGCLLLAEHIVAATAAVVVGPKKVLVLDLDNTLWGGIVGETGPLEVGLGETPEGEAYRQFQAHVKGLADRGVLLAVASKNNPADARGPFELNPGMVLRLEVSLRSRRAGIRRPIRCSELPSNSTSGSTALCSLTTTRPNANTSARLCRRWPWRMCPLSRPSTCGRSRAGCGSKPCKLPTQIVKRVRQYQAEPQRQLLRETCTTLDDYLQSLNMLAEVREIDEADLPRVVQLLGKTNQFNLTTRRHSSADVRRLLATPGAIGFTVRLADRFGDHGLIALMLTVPNENNAESLVIDSWLMSCRVIGRSVEQFVIDELIPAHVRLASSGSWACICRPARINWLPSCIRVWASQR